MYNKYFFQTDKQLSTPPLNGLILPGVTRRSILELASQWEDVAVKEEILTMDGIIELNKQGRVSLNSVNPFFVGSCLNSQCLRRTSRENI